MKFKYYNILAGVLLMVSCEKSITDIDTPSFDVTTESVTYKPGEAVTFNITGDANIVSFYSGEPLKEYAYRDGRVINDPAAGATLSFTSAIAGSGTQGTTSATAPAQLSVMVSTNFNENYNFASTQSPTTWTDITSRFKYGTNATLTASTDVDISDLQVAGKPLYIAYKYVTKPQATNGTARTWQIESFLIKSKKDIGGGVTPTITDLGRAGFRLIDQNPVAAPARSSLTSTRITLLGNLYDPTNDPGNDPLSENWAVSKPINLTTINLGPDRAVGIKDHDSTTDLTRHTHTYTKAGTYKATFVAKNLNLNESKEVIKEIEIVIKP